MIKKWFFLLLILVYKNGSAQTTLDTIVQPDTLKIAPVVKHRTVKKKSSILKTDSILRKAKRDSSLLNKNAVPEGISGLRNLLLPSQRPEGWLEESFKYKEHPYFTFTNPVHLSQSIRKIFGKEDIFYALVSLLIFFALIKNGFYRYVLDLFRIFFRTTVRQRQIKDQLIQSPLPSLLLNIFFIITGGLFIDVLLRNFKMGMQYDFWILFLYAALALIIIYAIKYLTLKFFGWVFIHPQRIPDQRRQYGGFHQLVYPGMHRRPACRVGAVFRNRQLFPDRKIERGFGDPVEHGIDLGQPLFVEGDQQGEKTGLSVPDLLIQPELVGG